MEPVSHPKGLVLLPVGLVLVLWGIALAFVSIGGMGDTPCGGLIDPSFDDPFSSENLCGNLHRGALVVTGGLIAGGCSILTLGVLSARGTVRLRVPLAVLAVMMGTALVAWLVLLAQSSAWTTDYDIRRWEPVRNLAGLTAAGVAAVLVVAAALTASDWTNAHRRDH